MEGELNIMKIIVIGALPSSLYNFRGELLQELALSSNNSVYAMASNANKQEIKTLNEMGVTYIDYPVSRNGLNPLEDIKTFLALKRIFKKEKPDVVLAYTIKPVVWGGLAARLAGVRGFYALITGLGFAFQLGGFKRNLLTAVVKFLYRQALKKSKGVIFQNSDNKQVFVQNELTSDDKCSLVNGSGVNLSHFEEKILPNEPRFLLISRLLGEKGIREYAKAASLVKAKFPHAQFDLLGPEDSSPDGIPLGEVNEWHSSGTINYLGSTNDVRPFIEACSIFVLPSYHEGMPRTVLEAMAMGRPILTTNVSGCKETVVNGKNGWLVEKMNVEQLAEKMNWFIEHQQEWKRMGDVSHIIATEKFDVNRVNKELLKIMKVDK
jgi:glycosyltransferase involved in cell wall biosynthesis